MTTSRAPYVLMSDLHCHNWSAFSKIEPDGMNSRLKITIDELHRANKELRSRGGRKIVIAGDIFHVRGSINPEVFNPVQNAFGEIDDSGTAIDIIPGNHDLSGKNTTQIGNATETLAEIDNLFVYTKPHHNHDLKYIMIPWEPDIAKLRDILAKYQNPSYDLIMHAGIDGVLTGVPDHGLTSAELAKYNYKRIFAGHYHNHKIMEGGKVISIGATTHQTYSDIGTKAGFLIVHEDRVEYRASHAPNFVEINETTDESEIPLLADGNYVRVRGLKLSDKQIMDLRRGLIELGARGVTIEVAREIVAARTVTTGEPKTIKESLDAYLKEIAPTDISEVTRLCHEVLTEATNVTV